MSILIVDDAEDTRLLLESILRKSSHTDIILAESASQAFSLLGLEEARPRIDIDIILMDIFMPGINGIEACRRIKAEKQLTDIPIIMVTADSDKKSLQEAFSLGAMDYVVKPFDKVELMARVRSALRLKYETDKRKARENELVVLTEQLQEANQVLRKISSVDGLTGVFNRRYFDEQLEQEWKRALRDKQPVSLIMLDIDYFKFYNDTYGHQAGDDCLKQVAVALREQTKRPADFVARYGGEEFAVVLPETDLAGAVAMAEELRRAVKELGIPHAGSKVRDIVSISLGVSERVPSNDSSITSLILSSDKALYRAKHEGRDRVAAGEEA